VNELTPLPSFWLAGFECSCHRRRDGRRLDLLEATGHDRFASQDYARLPPLGITTARDGLRWHRIDQGRGSYDFSELLPRLAAARASGVQVIWDLCHWGWPDDLDIWSPEFVRRFTRFAREAAKVVAAETNGTPWFVPMNEISFWAWAGGQEGYLNPFAVKRGLELKAQLVRAALAAIDAIRSAVSEVRFLYTDPLIRVTSASPQRRYREVAIRWHESQYESADMFVGNLLPELGGDETYLGVVGLNYYNGNQWRHNGRKILRGDPLYQPLSGLLVEAYRRYNRPLLIAETGAEGEARVDWLRYVGREVRAALLLGVPVLGICIYPILDYPGWDDDRYCPAGLWSYPNEQGERETYMPLAAEIRRQKALIDRVLSARAATG
jgi:beta-glucosidase/6-phospho-beta-glucosidase/beta-galactosidase